MTKYIVLGVVVASLLISTTALAATYGKQFVRAQLFGVVEGAKGEVPVFKLIDGETTCYVLQYNKAGGMAMSCVK